MSPDRFTLTAEISLGNDAMQNGFEALATVSALIESALDILTADQIEKSAADGYCRIIRDDNGNKVGRVEWGTA